MSEYDDITLIQNATIIASLRLFKSFLLYFKEKDQK